MDESEEMTEEVSLQVYSAETQDVHDHAEEQTDPDPVTDVALTSDPSSHAEPMVPPESEMKGFKITVSDGVDTGEGRVGEDVVEQRNRIPEDLYYDYEELCSKAFTTPDSNIPPNLLQLSCSYGYDCRRRANLQLLNEHTLAFVAGNVLVLLNIHTRAHQYIHSSGGAGIGTVMPHPSRRYFAVAEKGLQPNIIIYEYPSLRPYRVLRGGTGQAYSCVNFNREGTLLASVGGAPDYMLTVWDWKQEQVMLRYKAFSQDVYRVTFSPDNPGQLTTSGSGHIKFWKMANTFTGLKLQGILGRFGKTALTDIEGYVELPDGKVLSGSEWGNMLLWEGGLIKVEICRREGHTCHAGPIRQFILDEGELMSIGADGAVRCWDFETIDTADSVDDSGLFQMEPVNELIIGRYVSLSSMVKSTVPDSTIWFAQDSNGGIWKVDLSFSNMTQDPECLFSFHAGEIEGMDVSGSSHLMATTALDCSVRIFDILSKKELTVTRYTQGGTALTWAPFMAGEGVLVVGFEDGVVRLLELYDPKSLSLGSGRGHYGDAELRLKRALKPHNAAVTAISYDCNGKIMATGSVDCTVFFFKVGTQYEPIGFVTVPGPVKGLQWAPQSHERNSVLVACHTGHVVEIQAPDPDGVRDTGSTYHLQNLPISHFCFHSIKSRIKRDAELAHRRAVKEKKQKEREVKLNKIKAQGREPTEQELREEEEEEEELPPIFIPNPPSPLNCAFYSAQPGAFWLSMGGYDSGYLYHCKLSEQQTFDPSDRKDEPFAYIPIHQTDHNPILTICFSSFRQLLLCGMQDGSIRVYPLESGDLQPGSMQAYWALGVHDSQYGYVRHLRVSHDGRFVLSAGADGNIFAFSLLEPEELEGTLQRGQAKVPSPRVDLDTERGALDIEDPGAYSIETAKQKLELDRMTREAETRKQERRKTLAKLRNHFREVLQQNQDLPEHARLQRAELELDPCFREEAQRATAERVREVRKELSWEGERHRIGLRKLQERFQDAVVCDTVTVSAIRSDHKVSTYRLLALSGKFHQLKEQGSRAEQSGTVAQEQSLSEEQKDPTVTTADAITGASEGLPVLQPRLPQAGGGKLAGRQAEKLRKAAEKAQKARAKIEKRKKEWAELNAAKPSEDCEDPEDVRAIRAAQENVGDFKLKTAKDFTVPEHMAMNVEKKTAQLVQLEEQIFQKKSEMNARVLVLRDSKVALVSQFLSQLHQLKTLQELLPPEKRLPLPAAPSLAPEETPEKKLLYSRSTLQRYAALRAKMTQTGCDNESEELGDLLELLQQESEEEKQAEERDTHSDRSDISADREHLTKLEQEMKDVEEVQNLYLQDSLLKRMEEAVWRFDAELCLLRHDRLTLDVQMKLADLRHMTLFEELLLLREFEKTEHTLQENLRKSLQERNELRSKVQECQHQLELKRRETARLEERERALDSTFQASLGENCKFERFLVRVFKKKIKRAKKKETPGAEDSDADSDDDVSSYEDDEEEDESLSGDDSFDDDVCPPNCDQTLFENTLKLREHRLDLEELLVEEKKSADNLKKELDSLVKKEQIVLDNLNSAKAELNLFNREKQQKLNELDVVVLLRLHQIECVSNDMVPANMDAALVLNVASLRGLQQRIKELQQEKSVQRELYKHARQQHVQLSNDLTNMESKIQELEDRCQQLMMMKFGKLVDLEALQTLSGSRTLEEMRHESHLREAEHMQGLRIWQERVTAARQEVTEVTREHTERLLNLNSLLTEHKLLEDKLNARQKTTVSQFQGRSQAEEDERQRLHRLVRQQVAKIDRLRRELSVLSQKSGHVEPPSEPCLTPSPTHAHSRGHVGQ